MRKPAPTHFDAAGRAEIDRYALDGNLNIGAASSRE